MQRLDVLLHILADQVEPDFQKEELRIMLDFEQPCLSKAEHDNQHKANVITSSELEDMVEYVDDVFGKVFFLLIILIFF